MGFIFEKVIEAELFQFLHCWRSWSPGSISPGDCKISVDENLWPCTITYLLTYLLTPYSRVLLEKITGFAANQEIPHIL